MANAQTKARRGGARPGAGRPPGSLNKRSVEAIAAVAERYPDWSPLQHFATVANDETLEPSIRLEAAKAAAPFIHPRPKPVELDPAALVDLERQLVQVRLTAQDQILHSKPGLADRLMRAHQRLIVIDTEQPKALDRLVSDPIDGLSERLMRASATHRLSPPAGPEPARAAAPAPAPPPAPPTPAVYRPITPEPAPLRFSQTMDPNYRPFED